jgi:hypothetical protein
MNISHMSNIFSIYIIGKKKKTVKSATAVSIQINLTRFSGAKYAFHPSINMVTDVIKTFTDFALSAGPLELCERD